MEIIINETEGKKKKYAELIDKIPEFPLNKLFESTHMGDTKGQRGDEKLDHFISRTNSIFKTQKEFYESLINKFSIK